MKKHLAERREQSRQLAVRDAQARCTFCRRALPRIGIVIVLTSSGESLKYCGEDCQRDHVDALQTMEAHR